MSYVRTSGSKKTIEDILIYPSDDLNFNRDNPGVAYVAGPVDAGRNTIDFSQIRALRCRIVISNASGNEAGAGKGVCIYNETDAAVLCEVTWNGAASAQRVGAWTAINLNKEIVVAVYVKGSSATEDIKIQTTRLQLLMEN